MFAYFDEIQNELNKDASSKSHFKVGLILYDSDDKDTRENVITDFKDNFKVDMLIVYNMLLTGFDAPRLKRLYFGRKLRDHNLLQAITRVNRPYKNNRYGTSSILPTSRRILMKQMPHTLQNSINSMTLTK